MNGKQEDARDMTEGVDYSSEHGIATIAIRGFNRFNPISSAMFGLLAECFEQADADVDVRVVIFRGAGTENFSSGANLKETEERRGRNNIADYSAPHALARQRRNFWFPYGKAGLTTRMRLAQFENRKPCIAAISGYCLAAALLTMTQLSSLRIAGEGARFGFPEIRFGGGSGVAMSLLARQVQYAPLQRMAVAIDYIDARQALAMGMVNEVVADAQLFDRVNAIAMRIAQAPQLPLLAERRGLVAAEGQEQSVVCEIAAQVSSAVRLGI